MWIFAQEVVKTQPSDPVGWLLQGGAVAILGFLAWKLPTVIKIVINDREKLVQAFKEEMNEERKTFKDEVDAVRTRADARTDRIAARIEQAMNKMSDSVDRNTEVTREQVTATVDQTVVMKKNGKGHE